MIYVWSDTHFNHGNIITYSHRPFADVAEMNHALVERWNRTVRPQDTVYHLGDFGFNAKHEGTTPLPAIFALLHGHKHLVIGNHDERNPRVLELPWESQHDLVSLRENNVRAVACHYPLESWKDAHYGALMLHGHCHGNLKRKLPHRFDVGVDVRHDGPVSLGVLAKEAEAQVFEATDHHGEET